MKTYLKYLSRNKLYTVITVLGFATSLMFVFLLGSYLMSELRMEDVHSKADRIELLMLGEKPTVSAVTSARVLESIPEVEAYCRMSSSFTKVKRIIGEEELLLKTLLADSNMFEIFDFKLTEGNTNKALNEPNSIVISKEKSYQLFGDTNPIGESLMLNNSEYKVTAVLDNWPLNTHFVEYDAILPLSAAEQLYGNDALQDPNQMSYVAYALLKKTVADKSLDAKLTKLFDFDNHKIFTMQAGEMVQIEDASFMPIRSIHFGLSEENQGSLRYRLGSYSEVMTYLAIVLIIFFVALLNYVNLSLAQTSQLGKLSALKQLLGSNRRSIIFRNIANELFFFMSCVFLALGLALLFERQAEQILGKQLSILSNIQSFDILILFLLFLFVGGLAALIPSIVVSNFLPIEVIKGRFRMHVRGTFSLILIAIQFAVSIVLLICNAGIFLQVKHMSTADLGYKPRGLYTILSIPDSTQRSSFRQRIESLPSVESLSYGTSPWYSATYKGIKDKETDAFIFYADYAVDLAYFDVMKMNVKQFKEPELKQKAVYLTPSSAKLFAVDVDNSQVKLGDEEYTLEGMIPEIQTNNINDAAMPVVMRIVDEMNAGLNNTLIRLKPGVNRQVSLDEISKIVEEYLPENASNIGSVEDLIFSYYIKQTRQGKLLLIFSILSLLIMFMGVTAMSIYLMRQKEKTLAIRKVLGASERQQLAYLNTTVLRAFCVATLIAFPIAYFLLSRWLADFTYRIHMPWWLYLAVPLLLLIISLGITMAQSLHAARSNPIKYLKDE